MKILQRLKIKNFLNTPLREIDFTKNGDVVLVTGENAKGKTTIMRAIYMCLTGEDAFLGKTNLDNLIRYGSRFFEIELELVRGNRVIFISVRKEAHKTPQFTIKENGELLNISELADDARGILLSLFGTPKNLLNSYFFFSTADDDIVSVTDSRRLEIITESSQIFEEYEKISQQASIFEKELLKEITELNGQLQNTEGRVENIQQKYEEKMEVISSLTELTVYDVDKLDAIIQKKHVKIEEIKGKLNALKELTEMKREVADIEAIDIISIQNELEENEKNKELNAIITKETASILAHERAMKDKVLNVVKAKNEQDKKHASLSSKLSLLDRSIESLDKNDIVQDKAELEELEKKTKELENEKAELLSEWTTYKANIKMREGELDKMKELYEHNKVCPVCFSELSEKAYVAYIQGIENDITELQTKQLEVEENGKTIREELEKNYKTIENSKSHFKNLKVEKEKEEATKLLLQIEKKIEAQRKEVAHLEAEEKMLSNKRISLDGKRKPELSAYQERDKQAIINKFKSLSEILKKIEENETLVGDLNIAELNMEYSNERALIETLIRTAEQLKILIAQRQEEEENKDKIIQTLKEKEKDREQYLNIVQFYGKNGVQKRQVELILGSVERETNAIINKFFSNITVEFGFSPEKKGISLSFIRQYIGEDNNIHYMEDKIKNFSDAQQEMLRVIIRLSFSRAIQYLQGIPLNMIFFNETFAKLSEDKEGKLHEILKFFGEDNQVLFITHNKNITHYFPIEDTISL